MNPGKIRHLSVRSGPFHHANHRGIRNERRRHRRQCPDRARESISRQLQPDALRRHARALHRRAARSQSEGLARRSRRCRRRLREPHRRTGRQHRAPRGRAVSAADHDGGSLDQPILFVRSAVDRDCREPDRVGPNARRDGRRRRFDLDAAAPGSGQVETEQASRRRKAGDLHGDGQHRGSRRTALSGDARDAGRVRAAEPAALCESRREGLHPRRNRADESHDESGRQEDRRREAGRSRRSTRTNAIVPTRRSKVSRNCRRRSRKTVP